MLTSNEKLAKMKKDTSGFHCYSMHLKESLNFENEQKLETKRDGEKQLRKLFQWDVQLKSEKSVELKNCSEWSMQQKKLRLVPNGRY